MGGLAGRVREYVRLNGISYTARRAVEKFRDQYLREYDRLYRRVRATPADLEQQRHRAWKETPLISILVPVYNTNPRMLRELADSFLAQTYPHWEAVLLDGASTKPETAAMLREIAGLDGRFRVIFSGENLHISGNSNAALTHARGEWIALCDHDDLYTPDALYWVMDAVEREQPDFLYSDEDKVTEDGRVYFAAHFKPDYCPDNLRSGNYICHLMVMRRSLMDAAGGFRSAFDGSQDHDLALRCMEHTTRVTHIPRVLYHWRSVGSSMSHQNLMRCVDAARRAVEEHSNRVGPGRLASHRLAGDGNPDSFQPAGAARPDHRRGGDWPLCGAEPGRGGSHGGLPGLCGQQRGGGGLRLAAGADDAGPAGGHPGGYSCAV